MTAGIAAEKAALRARMLASRAQFDPEAGERLAGIALAGLDLPQHAAIAGVWPLPGEMDLRPLMLALHARGHRVLLPETPPRGNPLIFRLWTPGSTLIRERFGTFRPDGPKAVPDLIFVPLLAFDDAGNRLGYGGGFYDRTLAALPAAEAIGFGYAAQRVARVPAEAHDRRLQRVVTEAGILRTTEQDSKNVLF